MRAWVLGCCLVGLSATASAQVRHRRPLASAPAVRYGYDNNGSASGCRDYNCGARCYNGHSGTDFPVPLGTTVLASADGVVSATNNGCANYGSLGNSCGGRCGNYVQLDHSDGTRTNFCHMQLNSLMVSRGQRVRCGQALGRSASSGNSTGPHLHFGWRRSGVATDPYRGRCTSSPGTWTDQGSYGGSPGATCQCVPTAETCNGMDDDCDGRVDDGVCPMDAGTRPDVRPAVDVASDARSDVNRDVSSDVRSDVDRDVGSDVGRDDDVIEFEDVGPEDPDADVSPVGPTDPEEEPGCGCGVVGSDASGSGRWAWWSGAVLWAVSRRRRRAA